MCLTRDLNTQPIVSVTEVLDLLWRRTQIRWVTSPRELPGSKYGKFHQIHEPVHMLVGHG